MARHSRLKDHSAELRLFGRRIVAASFVIFLLLGALGSATVLPADRAARLLQRALAGQPHPDRPVTTAARADPRPQRRGAGAQPPGLPARTDPRADARPRRHARATRRAAVARTGGRRPAQEDDPGAAHLRRGADQAAALRRRTRPLRGPSPGLSGRRNPAAPHALLPARRARPCTRSATWVPSARRTRSASTSPSTPARR